MKKNNFRKVPIWVIALCVCGIVFYGYIFYIIASENFKYEVETDGTILVDNKKFIIGSNITSYYDADRDIFYIEGTLTNNTINEHQGISLNFAVYDLDGNILGNAYAYLDRIDENETWKFKASYDAIDATDAVSYKLIDVSYY